MTTRAQSTMLVKQALERGLILHARAPNGAAEYTAGPYTPATGHRSQWYQYVIYGYGTSRWIVNERVGSSWEVADQLVQLVGRGEGRRSVIKAEGKKSSGLLLKNLLTGTYATLAEAKREARHMTANPVGAKLRWIRGFEQGTRQYEWWTKYEPGVPQYFILTRRDGDNRYRAEIFSRTIGDGSLGFLASKKCPSLEEAKQFCQDFADKRAVGAALYRATGHTPNPVSAGSALLILGGVAAIGAIAYLALKKPATPASGVTVQVTPPPATTPPPAGISIG